ncbi:MAG: hypothetical protein OEY79_02155 [Anaplasmataceae bacterium]|nr:hypothetical protein [Anaplasmataceae bacterium]
MKKEDIEKAYIAMQEERINDSRLKTYLQWKELKNKVRDLPKLSIRTNDIEATKAGLIKSGIPFDDVEIVLRKDIGDNLKSEGKLLRSSLNSYDIKTGKLVVIKETGTLDINVK